MRRVLVTKLLLSSIAFVLLMPSAASACADCGLSFQVTHALYNSQPSRSARQPRAYRAQYYRTQPYRVAVKARYSPPIARTPLAIPAQVATGTTKVVVGTLETVKQLVGFFINKGWTAAQSFGLVANFYVESGLQPRAAANRGQFVGLAQWDYTRQATFRRRYGKAVQQATLLEQAEFAHWELTNTAATAGAMLKTAKTPAEAAAIVSRQYERPSRDEAYTRGAMATRLALSVSIPEKDVTAATEAIQPKPYEPKPEVPVSNTAPIAGAAGVPTQIVAFLTKVREKCGWVKIISSYRPGAMCHGLNQAVDYQVEKPDCAFAMANETPWKTLGHTYDYDEHQKHGVANHFHLSTCKQEAGWRGDHKAYYGVLGGVRHYAYARPAYRVRYARTRQTPYYAKPVHTISYPSYATAQ